MDVPQTRPLPSVRHAPRREAWSGRTRALVLGFFTLILALWLLSTPPGVDGKAHAVGYAICHQIPTRTFLVNGEPLPLCVRCTGIYLGVIVGLSVPLLAGRGRAALFPHWRVGAILVLFTASMGADGLNSYLGLFPNGAQIQAYDPTHTLRLITGSFHGVAMASFVLPAFNASVWRHYERRRALESVRELGGVLLVALGVISLVLLEEPVILIVVGYLSTLGVLTMLTMVNTVMFLALAQRENTISMWRGLLIPVLMGLSFAIAEIGLISLARFAFTGTWDGFSF